MNVLVLFLLHLTLSDALKLKTSSGLSSNFWPYSVRGADFASYLAHDRWCHSPEFMFAGAFGGGGCYSVLSQLGTLKAMYLDDQSAMDILDFPMQVAGCNSGGCLAMATGMALTVMDVSQWISDSKTYAKDLIKISSAREGLIPGSCVAKIDRGEAQACAYGEYCFERVFTVGCYDENDWLTVLNVIGCANDITMPPKPKDMDQNTYLFWFLLKKHRNQGSPSLKCFLKGGDGCNGLSKRDYFTIFGFNSHCVEGAKGVGKIARETGSDLTKREKDTVNRRIDLMPRVVAELKNLFQAKSVSDVQKILTKIGQVSSQTYGSEEEYHNVVYFKNLKRLASRTILDLKLSEFLRRWEVGLARKLADYEDTIRWFTVEQFCTTIYSGKYSEVPGVPGGVFGCVSSLPLDGGYCGWQSGSGLTDSYCHPFQNYSYLALETRLCKLDFAPTVGLVETIGPTPDFAMGYNFQLDVRKDRTFLQGIAGATNVMNSAKNMMFAELQMVLACPLYTLIVKAQTMTGQFAYPFQKPKLKFLKKLLQRWNSSSFALLGSESRNTTKASSNPLMSQVLASLLSSAAVSTHKVSLETPLTDAGMGYDPLESRIATTAEGQQLNDIATIDPALTTWPLSTQYTTTDGALIDNQATGVTVKLMDARTMYSRPKTLLIFVTGTFANDLASTAATVILYYKKKTMLQSTFFPLPAPANVISPLVGGMGIPLLTLCPLGKMEVMNFHYLFQSSSYTLANCPESQYLSLSPHAKCDGGVVPLSQSIAKVGISYTPGVEVTANSFWQIGGDFEVNVAASLVMKNEASKKWVLLMYSEKSLRGFFKNFPYVHTDGTLQGLAMSFGAVTGMPPVEAFAVMTYSNYRGYMLNCAMQAHFRESTVDFRGVPKYPELGLNDAGRLSLLGFHSPEWGIGPLQGFEVTRMTLLSNLDHSYGALDIEGFAPHYRDVLYGAGTSAANAANQYALRRDRQMGRGVTIEVDTSYGYDRPMRPMMRSVDLGMDVKPRDDEATTQGLLYDDYWFGTSKYANIDAEIFSIQCGMCVNHWEVCEDFFYPFGVYKEHAKGSKYAPLFDGLCAENSQKFKQQKKLTGTLTDNPKEFDYYLAQMEHADCQKAKWELQPLDAEFLPLSASKTTEFADCDIEFIWKICETWSVLNVKKGIRVADDNGDYVQTYHSVDLDFFRMLSYYPYQDDKFIDLAYEYNWDFGNMTVAMPMRMQKNYFTWKRDLSGKFVNKLSQAGSLNYVWRSPCYQEMIKRIQEIYQSDTFVPEDFFGKWQVSTSDRELSKAERKVKEGGKSTWKTYKRYREKKDKLGNKM